MSRAFSPLALRIICLAVATALHVAYSDAANITSKNITGMGAVNFTTNTIWDGDAVPGVDDIPIINSGDGITDYVYVDNAVEVQRYVMANLEGDSGGLEIRNGGTLTTNNTGTSYVGARDVGYLRVLEGANFDMAGDLQVGWSATGVGTVTQTGGNFSLGQELVVGREGDGAYELDGGMLTIATYVQIGRTGTGTFTQTAGDLSVNRVSPSPGFVISSHDGGLGVYEISGGSLTIAETNSGLLVGNPGDEGRFTVTGNDATISLGSNYEQSDVSVLELNIGAGISPLNVNGDVILDGILDVQFAANPTPGDEFTVFNYGGNLTGRFASFDNLVDSPAGADTVRLAIDYGAGMNSSVVLSVIEELGDFDNSGMVDEADFFILSDHLAAHLDGPVAYVNGDIDQDGDIDLDDFGQFKDLFPEVVAAALGTTVPEPVSLVLGLAAIGAMVAMKQR